MPDPIQLIRESQATNRDRFAQSVQNARSKSESNLNGRVLGKNADTGQTMVQLDGGGVVPATSCTNGNLDGKSAIVTINGSIAWVDGMPV